MIEKAGRLFGKLIYNIDLFDRETIARMAGHFKRCSTASRPTRTRTFRGCRY